MALCSGQDRRAFARGSMIAIGGESGGGEHRAVIASLIETCKLNGAGPQAYLAAILSRIVNGHPNSAIDEPMPWACA
jgi:hypothetical protein